MSSNNFWIKLAQDIGFHKHDKVMNMSQDPNKDKYKNRVKTPILKLNTQQQADILYLPADKNGFKYCLVVADYGRQIGAVPLKALTTDEVVKGFKTIYATSNLTPPAIMQFDNGPEFKGKVLDYFKANSSAVKNTKPYRSRQNGLVESVNFIIGKLIGLHHNSKPLKERSKFEWVKFLPKIIKAYNDSQKDVKPPSKMNYPPCSGDACTLLKIGDSVRIPLEHPIDPNTGELLPTKKFRSNDIRYSPKVYHITSVILKPNTPPLYMVKQKYKVAYTKKQLMEVDNEIEELDDEDEELPEDVYIIEKFLDKRKHNGRVQFLVKYKDYDDEQSNLWQDRTFLIAELGNDQFKQFEREFNA